MKAYETGAKRAYLSAGAISLFTTIGFSTVLGVLWYGGYLVINEKITIGKLSSFILYTINMSTSVLMLGGILNQVITAIGVSEKLFQMMDLEVKIVNGKFKEDKSLMGNIKFENVCFEYPTKKDVQVLKNLSFEVKKGETVALVGSSGCGKSSIVSLIERFYDSQKGQVLVDDKNIQDYDWEWYH